MPNPRSAPRTSTLLLAAVAASVCALLATMLSTPALASSQPTERAAATHTQVAKKHDRVFRARHALARAQKALSPSTPAAERPDATLALRTLWLLRDSLSPADRAAADKLAARPSKPAVVGNANVLVHYDPIELSPTGYTIDQALAALALVSDTYAGSGYRRPKSDGTKGGDGRIDIYLHPLEPGLYGYCTTDQRKPVKPGRFDVWAYCVLDNDYAGFPSHTSLENLQVTAAHEYYHAVQFAYDIAEDRWFMEATATWAEDEVYDTVNDNAQYLRDSPIARPSRSMDKFGGVFHYGVWNFFRYLSEVYPAKTGAMPGLLLKMWKYADSSKGPRKDMYSTQAIDKALKKTDRVRLGEMFSLYTVATRLSHVAFNEGVEQNYPVKPLAGSATLSPGKKKTFKAELDHLTSATFQFLPNAFAGTKKLKLRFDMPPKSAGSRAVVVLYNADGSLSIKTVRINARGKANKKFTFGGSVSLIEVTLVNASTRFRDCFRRETPISCSGRAIDDNLRSSVRGQAS